MTILEVLKREVLDHQKRHQGQRPKSLMIYDWSAQDLADALRVDRKCITTGAQVLGCKLIVVRLTGGYQQV